jgi:hypothetical protein
MDFVDPGLNAVNAGLNATDVASTGVSIIGGYGSWVTGAINMARGIGQFMMGIFKVAQNVLSMIFQALGLAGIFAFIISMIMMITKGSANFGVGFGDHLICGANQFGQGWENQGYIMGILANCSWEKFSTFLDGSCTRYYIVDMVFGLIYGVFIELPLILLRAIFGIDLQVIIDVIYNLFILPLDSIFFAISGFHLVKWSDSVINHCYRCKGKYKFSDGKEVTLHKTFAEWAKLMNCSFEQIIEGFMRMFTTIIPSNKWWSWINGDHVKASDWDPKFFGVI